jgi:hypothetical protein
MKTGYVEITTLNDTNTGMSVKNHTTGFPYEI